MKNNNKNLSTSGKANSGVNGSNNNVIKAFRMPAECTFHSTAENASGRKEAMTSDLPDFHIH